jgi:hypothetical protein
MSSSIVSSKWFQRTPSGSKLPIRKFAYVKGLLYSYEWWQRGVLETSPVVTVRRKQQSYNNKGSKISQITQCPWLEPLSVGSYNHRALSTVAHEDTCMRTLLQTNFTRCLRHLRIPRKDVVWVKLVDFNDPYGAFHLSSLFAICYLCLV